MSLLWAVLLSLLCVTAAKHYYGNEELSDSQFFLQDDESMISQDDKSMIQDEADYQYINEADSQSFFQDDEPMIQDEVDFQYINEAEENTNLEFADEMSDCGTLSKKNQGEIQKKQVWTKLRKHFKAKCPKGAAIYFVQSKYSTLRRDRKWYFKCRKVSGPRGVDCDWKRDIISPETEDGEESDFECGDNEYLAGVESKYNSGANDRSWDAFCCKSKKYCILNDEDCDSTGYKNEPKKKLLYTAPRGYVFTGLSSKFSKGRIKRDRSWGLTVCPFKKCSSGGNSEGGHQEEVF